MLSRAAGDRAVAVDTYKPVWSLVAADGDLRVELVEVVAVIVEYPRGPLGFTIPPGDLSRGG
jgi:hypothetical protein